MSDFSFLLGAYGGQGVEGKGVGPRGYMITVFILMEISFMGFYYGNFNMISIIIKTISMRRLPSP